MAITLKKGGDAAQYERDGVPFIELMGERYFIPPLAPRQNRRIIPMMSRLGEINFKNMNEQTMDDLYMIIYWALTRAYDVTESEFMDLPIPITDLIPCMAVITEQTGLAKLTPVGEAKAAGTELTSTSSSPEPAPQPDGSGTTSRTRTFDA